MGDGVALPVDECEDLAGMLEDVKDALVTVRLLAELSKYGGSRDAAGWYHWEKASADL